MKLYVSRHGQTTWNLDRRLCGRKDVPLTDAGVRQAEALAADAADKGISVVIASPLQRAQNTARIVADACGVELLTDERLVEQDFGQFEGADYDDPDLPEYKTQLARRFPGGESILQVASRVYPLLDEIREKYSDHPAVLLVAHGIVCRVIHSYFADLTDAEFMKYGAKNAQLTEYVFDRK